MAFLQFLIPFEMLIFNLITINFCCHRKYSLFKTVLGLAGFTAAFYLVLIFVFRYTMEGDARAALTGFLYLIPFRFLYKEKPSLLFVITCMCWVYTLGIVSLSIQTAALFWPDQGLLSVFILVTLLFFGTIVPFFSRMVPKYVFILENIPFFGKNWYRYLALSTCVNFFLLLLVHIYLLSAEPSFMNLAILAMLLSAVWISYLILYMVVLGSVQMNRLKKAALQDPLTGLGNRAMLLEDLSVLIRSDSVFSILFMDLDRFKEINDHYGHAIGDEYLKHFGEICSRTLQEQGRIYRFGGDEFVALYYGPIPDEMAERLKECREWDTGAPCPFNQVSAGILICEPPHKSCEDILRQVDQLMYKNKCEHRLDK